MRTNTKMTGESPEVRSNKENQERNERKREKEKERKIRQNKEKREKKRNKERNREKKREQERKLCPGSIKEKLNILAEMLEISKSGGPPSL